MSSAERPGGLTALAVINFIFGGFEALAVLAMLAGAGIVASMHSADPNHQAQVQPLQHLVGGVLVVLAAVMAVRAILLISSGVGYLQQKRILGRHLGNIYACISLVSTVIGMALLHQKFGLGSIIGMVYPLLTLYLLNVVFRDDLVN